MNILKCILRRKFIFFTYLITRLHMLFLGLKQRVNDIINNFYAKKSKRVVEKKTNEHVSKCIHIINRNKYIHFILCFKY